MTSNPHLPPEILDYIVDFLHNNPATLKLCCLVSKSWVPRTRKHLFAHIQFRSAAHLNAWNRTFSDPIHSPAYHARTLTIGLFVLSDTGGSNWIPGFTHVARLRFQVLNPGQVDVLFPEFQNLAPPIKSLFVQFFIPQPHVSNLV